MKSESDTLSFCVEGDALLDLYRFLNKNSGLLTGELEVLYYNIQNELYSRFTVAEFEEITSK